MLMLFVMLFGFAYALRVSLSLIETSWNFVQNMDYMDIDQVPDVPDTPDRLAAQDVNGRQVIEIGSDSSAGNTDFSSEAAKNQLRARSKLVLDNGHRKSLFFRPGKNVSISNKSEVDGDFKGKAVSTTQSHNLERNDVVDLMEWRGPAQVFHNDVPNAVLEDGFQAKEFRKGSISTNGLSSLRGISNSSVTAVNTCRGKEKVNDTCKGGSGLDCGKGTFGDSLPEVGNGVSSSFYSGLSPRVGGRIRFVRDGCISPRNIAKAKQFAENHSNGSIDLQNDRGTSSNSSLNLVRDLIAGGNNVDRRGGVIFQPSSSEEPAAKTIDLATRSSIAHNEQICGTSNASGDAFRCFEGFGGWRNTRNRTKKFNLPLFDEGQHLSRTKDDASYVNQQNESKVVRRDSGKGISSRIDNEDREDQNAVSFQNGCALSEAQAVSRPMAHSVHVTGHRGAASTLMKRQKQGSTSSNHGQSSTSAAVDSEFVILASSKEPLNSRSTRNHSNSGPRILDSDHPVIEVDGFSPEVRHYGSDNRDASSNGDSDDRARQVEADEMLARELQEQLYHESPGVEDEEFDALITSARQREVSSQHSYSGGSHPVFHPSGSLTSNSYRQSRSLFSQNPSMYGGTNAQGPASARLTRLRSRVRSQLPRISYRESGSLFPPSMDLDMRMHILEALEAFSDMEMAGNLLQVDREFNENDYEMLLALDENNHHHVGASLDQINSLPLSTVQGENFEEACAICLETPTSGDSIRHLPCLHKFHKDDLNCALTHGSEGKPHAQYASHLSLD
ncbi:hypothetical protein RHSIM_Rhsim02G0053500 [Rhododendron simsii]|uniref:RING/U-box superfamily protein n=1 Tax=Rhododendron simsii TaxID=118357 RepID=A0A834HFL6_RHOSS|nr:hypothetical protein RHSIM_Rhsim02G0053500 [Rhododendron simsii]